MGLSPEKQIIFNNVVKQIGALLKLPYGAGKLAEPVKRQIARECINRFTAAELGQVRLGEYPVWFVEPYVNQRFRGVPAPAAPAVEPEMNTTVAATAGRLNSRAQDVFLTVHRVALQRTLETRVPRGSPEFRPLWRSFGCRRYKMLSATERKKYMVAALSARTKMRAPNGQWQFLLADEVAEQDIAIDLDSFIAEISKNKKITPKELLDEVVRIEKTDAGKGALKKASDRLMIPQKTSEAPWHTHRRAAGRRCPPCSCVEKRPLLETYGVRREAVGAPCAPRLGYVEVVCEGEGADENVEGH
jgi:hypothetical protein